MLDRITPEPRWSLKWNGHVVGWIENPKVDQPFYYGHWLPDESPEAVQFLNALSKAVANEDGLDVLLEDMFRGRVLTLPDEDGTIDVRWGVPFLA